MIENFVFWYYDHKPKLIEDLEYLYGKKVQVEKISKFDDVNEYDKDKVNVLVFYWDGQVHNRADSWRTKELWTWNGFTYTVPFMLFLNKLHSKGFLTVADYVMESDTAMKAEYYYFFELMRELGVNSKKLLFCSNNSYSLKLDTVVGDKYEFRALHFPHFLISTRRNIGHQPDIPLSKKTKTFTCFNGKVRPHKLDFIKLLADRNLIQTTNLTMVRIPLDTKGLIGVRKDYRELIDKLGIDLENFRPRLLSNDPATVDEILNFTYKTNPEWYNEAKVDLVTETWFKSKLDDRWKCWNPMIHLTEKTWKPIAYRCPFVVSATPGHLGALKRFGFTTFETVIDETYDTAPDSHRMEDALNSAIELSKVYKSPEVLEICKHNSNLFFNDAHKREIVENVFLSELTNNLNFINETST